MGNSLQESMERLSRQSGLLDEPLKELQELRQRLSVETERFLSSVARAAGGRPLSFSWGSLQCVIRKGANGSSCDCRVEEKDEEVREFASDLSLDLETAIRVYILSHREEIIEACTRALEEQSRLLVENIENMQTLIG